MNQEDREGSRKGSPQVHLFRSYARSNRFSIDGFSFERVAQSNLEWIFSKLDSGFQSLVGFRIPSAGFRIPKPRIPDSTSKKFLDSGIRIPLHGAKNCHAPRVLHFNFLNVVGEGVLGLADTFLGIGVGCLINQKFN